MIPDPTGADVQTLGNVIHVEQVKFRVWRNVGHATTDYGATLVLPEHRRLTPLVCLSVAGAHHKGEKLTKQAAASIMESFYN
jgi:hypothetical protein